MAISISAPRRRKRWPLVLGLLMCTLGGVLPLRMRQLPPLPVRTDRPVRGAFHLHAARSHDSDVSVEQYAQAARAQGLDFIVLADHDVQDGSPRIVDGVLVLPQAELNTPFGHLLSLGAARALNGEERDDPHCIERLRSLGGGGIAAHPTSRRRPWAGPLDGLLGIEVQNTASTFEAYAGPAYAWAAPLALAYALAPRLALAQLYGRDARSHAAWDRLAMPAIGVCGIDAHGWLRPDDDVRSWHIVMPDVPRPAAWDADFAAPVLAALTAGQFYTASGLWDGPLAFDFAWRSDMGDGRRLASGGHRVRDVPAQHRMEACLGDAGGMAHPHIASAATLVLLHDGDVVAQGPPPCVRVSQPATGVWRAELRVQLPALWVGHTEGIVAVSNRIELQ